MSTLFFLRPFRIFFLLEFYLYALTHTKFLLSQNLLSDIFAANEKQKKVLKKISKFI